MSKTNVKVDDGKVKIGLDSDQDGKNSVSLNLIIDEAVQEIFNKGEAIEGKALVDFKFLPTGEISLSLDTDKDGEPSLQLEASIMEALQEAGVL